MFSTLDGGIGGVIAVTESNFRILEDVRKRLVKYSGIERIAGANPDEQTTFHPESCSTALLDQRMLDSRAVFDLFELSLVEIRVLLRECGDPEGVMRAILDLDTILARF